MESQPLRPKMLSGKHSKAQFSKIMWYYRNPNTINSNLLAKNPDICTNDIETIPPKHRTQKARILEDQDLIFCQNNLRYLKNLP